MFTALMLSSLLNGYSLPTPNLGQGMENLNASPTLTESVEVSYDKSRSRRRRGTGRREMLWFQN
ncbi:hypothetical protein [Spirulina subsalsa]|uniref:hypothetical protein n=1 Tax=Spirulina subsalsa TaxID=54311 RepID=UPI0002D3DF89|nr:hypothetical protein [Spirulina subsalsa]